MFAVLSESGERSWGARELVDNQPNRRAAAELDPSLVVSSECSFFNRTAQSDSWLPGCVAALGPTRRLQPQLAGAVLAEQIAVPDVPSDHLNRTMPGLVHDRAF